LTYGVLLLAFPKDVVARLYDKSGRILRTGGCPRDIFELQAHKDEFIIEGTANDVTQKIVDGKVTNKTSEEIEAEKLPKISFEERTTHITNKQWQEVLDRIKELESK